jgi:hypothetical protein
MSLRHSSRRFGLQVGQKSLAHLTGLGIRWKRSLLVAQGIECRRNSWAQERFLLRSALLCSKTMIDLKILFHGQIGCICGNGSSLLQKPAVGLSGPDDDLPQPRLLPTQLGSTEYETLTLFFRNDNRQTSSWIEMWVRILLSVEDQVL